MPRAQSGRIPAYPLMAMSEWLPSRRFLDGAIDRPLFCLPPYGSPVPLHPVHPEGSLLATRPEISEHPGSFCFKARPMDIRTCICERAYCGKSRCSVAPLLKPYLRQRESDWGWKSPITVRETAIPLAVQRNVAAGYQPLMASAERGSNPHVPTWKEGGLPLPYPRFGFTWSAFLGSHPGHREQTAVWNMLPPREKLWQSVWPSVRHPCDPSRFG